MGYEEIQNEVEETLQRWDRVTILVPDVLARKYIITDIDWAEQHGRQREETQQGFDDIQTEIQRRLDGIATESRTLVAGGISEHSDLDPLEAELDGALDALRRSNSLDREHLLEDEQRQLDVLRERLQTHAQAAEHALRFARARRAQFQRAATIESRIEELETELREHVTDSGRIKYSLETFEALQADLDQVAEEIERYGETVESSLPPEAETFLRSVWEAVDGGPTDVLKLVESPTAARLHERHWDVLTEVRCAQTGLHLARADAAVVDATEAFGNAYQRIEEVKPERAAIQDALEFAQSQLSRADEVVPDGGRIRNEVEAAWTDYRRLVSRVESAERFAEQLEHCDDAISTFRTAYADHCDDDGVPDEHLPRSTIESLQAELRDAIEHCNVAAEEIPSITATIPDYEEALSRRREEIAALRDDLKTHNETFAEKAAEQYPEVFTNQDGDDLNNRQQKAIIASEDRVLISAPAGTGKTTTIDNRVRYLVNVEGVATETILATGFAKATVNELEDRINVAGIRSDNVDKLAKEIAQAVEPGYKLPDTPEYDSPTETIAKELFDMKTDSDSLFYDQEFERDLVRLENHWVPEYDVEPPEEISESSNLTSLDRIEHYLETHGFDISRDEPIRAVEEGLGEGEYAANLYLEEFDIVISHLPIESNPFDSRQAEVDPLEAFAELATLDDVAIHDSASMSLEELRATVEWEQQRFSELDDYDIVFTYEWELQDGTLTDHLEHRLLGRFIVPIPIEDEQFLEANTNDSQELSSLRTDIREKLATALEKAQTRGVATSGKQSGPNDPQQAAIADGGGTETIQELYPDGNPLYTAFADVLSRLYDDFGEFREDRGYNDFIDLKRRAARHLKDDTENSTLDPYQFDHIIVDEFQDISPPDMQFLDALAQASDGKMYCVGDDWQSIYGFRGTTPEYFLDFEEHFDRETNVVTLNETYRNPQPVVDASRRLISNNPDQREKDISAALNKRGSITLHKPLSSRMENKTTELVASYFNPSGTAEDADTNLSDIMVIARNTDQLNEIEQRLRKEGVPVQRKRNAGDSIVDDKVVTTTAHSAKGDSAHHVIIHNAVDDRYGGFPDTRDGSLTNPVEPGAANTYESERRLFYVALTRTKHTVDIVTKAKQDDQSRFIRELRPDFQQRHEDSEIAARLSRAELERIKNHGVWEGDHRVLQATPFDAYTAQSLIQHADDETETGVALFQFAVEVLAAARPRFDTTLGLDDAVEFYHWYVSETDLFFAEHADLPEPTVENALAPFTEEVRAYNQAVEEGVNRLFGESRVSTLLTLVETIDDQPLVQVPSAPTYFGEVMRTYAHALDFERQRVETIVEALELIVSSFEDYDQTADTRRVQNCANHLRVLQDNLSELRVPYPLESAADLRWRLPELEMIGTLVVNDEDLHLLRRLKRLSRDPKFDIIVAATGAE